MRSARRWEKSVKRGGRRRIFEALRDYLAAERQDVSYLKLSNTLGVPEATVKRLLHQLRLRDPCAGARGGRANRRETGRR